MKVKMDVNQYYEKKLSLLKECVLLSDEIRSNIDEISVVNGYLDQRASVIHNLQILKESYGKVLEPQLSDTQRNTLDQRVSLLLSLDRDTAKKLKISQDELKSNMKTNTQTHKLINYTANFNSPNGHRMNIKK